MTNQIALRDHY